MLFVDLALIASRFTIGESFWKSYSVFVLVLFEHFKHFFKVEIAMEGLKVWVFFVFPFKVSCVLCALASHILMA